MTALKGFVVVVAGILLGWLALNLLVGLIYLLLLVVFGA
jgi:hypothetical protein